MTWGAIGAATISVVGGAMMSKGGGGGDAQVQQASAADKAAADISREQWDRYKARYMPLEDQYVDQAQGLGSIANQNKAAQQAAADTASTFAGARQRLDQQVGGLSGQAKQEDQAALSMQEAASSAAGQNVARSNVVNQGRAAMTDAVSLGKGLPATATSGLISAGSGLQAAGQYAQGRSDRAAAGFGKIVGGLQPAIDKFASGNWGASSSTPQGGSTAPGGVNFGSDIGQGLPTDY